jgi:hypothetical protein
MIASTVPSSGSVHKCGLKVSVSGMDPHRFWSAGSGSRRAKRPTKIEKVKKFHILKRWMFSFEGQRLLL